MKKHILIADDDEDDIELYKDAVFFSSLPMTISTASNCDEIFKVIEAKGLPDTIVVDGNMPNKTLDECIYAIRAKAELNKIPVVVLSGTIDRSNVKKYYDAGINLYLTKPSSLSEIGDIFNVLFTVDWVDTPVLTTEEFLRQAFILRKN